MSSVSSSRLSTESSPSPTIDALTNPVTLALSQQLKPEAVRGEAEINGHSGSVVNLLQKDSHVKREGSLSTEELPSVALNMAERNGTYTEGGADDTKPLNMSSAIRTEDKGHPERKRRASSDSLDSYQTKASESAADDISKDDEEENDDDDDEKLAGGTDIDPERLKAFNMFVRLFVDENLDRMVPISKQPKDKIQAILDACDRQFPEFHERSRKRIRTYLKSCRRMRRSKDTNGWDQLRPTPPHLTSAAAEGILAQACENESNNAKRMRMGLDPLPVNTSQATSLSSPAVSLTQQTTSNSTNSSNSPSQTTIPAPLVSGLNHSPSQPPALEKQSPAVNDIVRRTPSVPTAFRPPHELPSPFFTNSNGIFRPGFPSSYQSPAHVHPPVIQHTPLTSQIQNGPTDLSMKKSSLTPPSTKSQLNSTEVVTIKQLIAGYRESAAFLYRSADELEQLLLHQN